MEYVCSCVMHHRGIAIAPDCVCASTQCKRQDDDVSEACTNINLSNNRFLMKPYFNVIICGSRMYLVQLTYFSAYFETPCICAYRVLSDSCRYFAPSYLYHSPCPCSSLPLVSFTLHAIGGKIRVSTVFHNYWWLSFHLQKILKFILDFRLFKNIIQNKEAMSLKEVCRACLCTGRTMCCLTESIVPKFDSPPNTVMDLWKIFTRKLITLEGSFPDKICMGCLDEIQRTYSFMVKCERSEQILKKMKNFKICLKKLKIGSELRDHYNLTNIKSENVMYSAISQIKTENIQWNRILEGDKIAADRGKFEVHINTNDSQTDPQTQDPLMIQLEGDNLRIDLLHHLDCTNDAKKGAFPFIQNIKGEPELKSTENGNVDEKFAVYRISEGNEIDADKDQFEVYIHANDSQVEARSQDSSMDQLEGDNLVIDLLDQWDCKNDIRMEEASFIQDIKQEPELDISTEDDSFDENECQDESGAERFKCSGCGYECQLRENLAEHLIENHVDGKMCKLCNKEFKYCSAIEHSFIHADLIHDRPKSTKIKCHKCKVCSKKFRHKSTLTTHLIIHTGERPFKCETCPKAFRIKHQLTAHLKIHTGERPFECKICQKAFRIKHHLTSHLRCHTGEKPFKCKICPKTYQQKNCLTIHSRCHTGELLFKCEKCLKTFGRKRHLTSHLRCHTGEKPFKCEICSKSFREKCHLTVHSRRHTGERPFKCETCRRSFNRKDNLKDHLRCHTGERPYKCEICGKTFQRTNNLRDHLRCHTGELKYECETCLKTFVTTRHLKSHLRSHTEEKSFKCEICSKSFVQKSNLMEHLSCHKEERSFKCESCPKAFSIKSYLKKHLELHIAE